jgi:signal transduction histidine kinase
MNIAWARRYVRDMQAVRRLAGGDPGMVADAGMGIAAAGLTALAVWGPNGLVGTTVSMPAWLLALLPLLMGVALALRRRAPLLMWTLMWAGVALQDLVTRQSPQNLAFALVLFAGAYALGAYASVRRAAVGLAISAVLILATEGVLLAFSRHPRGVALSLFSIPLLACWLAGVIVRARRQSADMAARNAALQRQAEQAAAAERARIARELHDIVAHHLSVVVLQAAGARASGKPAGPALEKIENSARHALADTRRLLGVLRDTGGDSGLAPQPGISELDELAGAVRAGGLPVNLVIDGDPAGLPAAVDVSVYRIVQEALTNVLKHAGPASADVRIGCVKDAVTIEVTDNGTGVPASQAPAGGHGLAGMRERVAVFDGELCTGPRPDGGFAVRVRLPINDRLPPGEPS